MGLVCISTVRLTSTCSLAAHFLIQILKVLVRNRSRAHMVPRSESPRRENRSWAEGGWQ